MTYNRLLSKIIEKKSSENWVAKFLRFDISLLEEDLLEKPPAYWNNIGRKQALKIFHSTAKRVPAYKDFLRKNKISSGKIRTINDFNSLPVLNKGNYVDKYSLSDRSWDGMLHRSDLIAASSGTSGTPRFWPRSQKQEFVASLMHELVYKSLFNIDKKKTLLLIGFPMGIYVSGVATLLPSWLIGSKGYDITTASIGNNKREFLSVFKNLRNTFEQFIFLGHPFFIKDVIDAGSEENIKWREYDIKMFLCSEGFTEPWRDNLLKKVGGGKDSIISTYGSSELLLMAHETPMTIALRRHLNKHPRVLKSLFPENLSAPSLFQYNPLFHYIESVENELIFTSLTGVPMVRYNLKDSGSILDVGSLPAILPVGKKWNLPVVALRGRSDNALIFYAANIYADQIHDFLNSSNLLKIFTGKFTMRKGLLKNFDEYLEVNIELRLNQKDPAGSSGKIQQLLFEHLKNVNMEYLDMSKNTEKNVMPKINFWAHRHKKYFSTTGKHSWVIHE